MRRVRSKGFTLIELMIVVAIIAIVAALAYPSFQDSVRKGRRADAVSALIKIQMEQERWRVNNVAYAADLATLGLGTSSDEGYYTLSIDAGSDGVSWAARAVPNALGNQNQDLCAVIAINQDGPVEDAPTSARECWNRR